MYALYSIDHSLYKNMYLAIAKVSLTIMRGFNNHECMPNIG